MMRLMSEKKSISVVADQVGSPTYAADLAAAIMQIVTYGKWTPGIYHFSNEGIIIWFALAVEIKNLLSSTCEVLPIKTDAYPTPAKRPAYSVMDTSKIKTTYALRMIPWKESLRKCMELMQAKA
jgi:dTDP-4-dehydrorhamnose reductase